MCVAIPSQVVDIGDSTLTVERLGERIVVSRMLLTDAVELGDYVIIQARAYAIEKVGAAEAQESLALFREWIALADTDAGAFEDSDEVGE